MVIMKKFLFGTSKLIGLLGLVVGSAMGYAQTVNNYSFSTGTGAVLDPMAGATTLIGTSVDDNPSALQAMGFNFTYEGVTYTNFSTTPDGFVKLGNVATTSDFSNQLTENTNLPKLSALWDDFATGTTGAVTTALSGTPGNYIRVVQWFVTIPRNLAGPANATIQLWMYENGGVIRFVYGANTGNPGSASCGLTGAVNTNFISVTNSTHTASNAAANDVNAVYPGSGRFYLFTPPAPLDAQALALNTPLATGCYTNAEAVSMTVKNNGTAPIDFNITPMAVTVNVTGAATQTFNVNITNNTINGGVSVAPGATVNVPMGTLDMSAAGTYTFDGSVTIVGDPVAANDIMPTANRLVAGGIASTSVVNLCAGDSVSLSLSGHSVGGTVQWQDSLSGGPWTNIPGATTATVHLAPTDTAYYRAIVCSANISTSVLVNVVSLGNPTTIDTTRCGVGPVSLIANGNAAITWYDLPSGGSAIGTGDTLVVTVSSDTVFYAANGTGNPPTFHTTTFAAGNGFNANMFPIHALTTVTITGFDGHTASTGLTSWDVYYRPNDYLLGLPGSNTSNAGWNLLGSASGVTGAGTGNPTPIPVTFSVTIPAGSTYSFYVAETSGAGVQYTNGTTLGAVYDANADFEVIQGHGGDLFNCTNQPRVFNGNIYYYSGCSSARVPLNVTVVPAPAISFASTATAICDVDTVTLSVTSLNTSYNYSYTPTTYLSDSVGNPISAWPQADITYVVAGLDTAGCAITDTVSITVDHAPTGTLTTSDNFTCYGDSVNLSVFTNGTGSYTMTNPALAITDSNPVGVYDTLTVAGAPATLSASSIVSVCIDVTHTFDADLDIYLISPLGTQIELTTDNGGLGDNYTNTCFDMTALTAVTAGVAPFSGSFIPEGTFNAFNGENANGDWKLWLVDDLGGDFGTLNSWTITFAGINNIPVSWSSIPGGLADTTYSVAVNPILTTTYIVTITDSLNGCGRNYLDTVVVNPLPIVSLGTDTAICSNYAGITLDGTNAGAGTYAWQDDQNTPTYFASLPGQYVLEVTDTNGCIGSDTINVGTITAQVVSIDANLVTIHSADLDAGAGFASYAWSTSAGTQVINVTNNGTYFVTCVDQNGCVSTDTLSIVFSLGNFNPNGSETVLQLFPNPSQGSFSLNIENLETTDLTLDVIDMSGKVVYNRYIGSVSGSFTQPFSLEELRAGTYTLRVTANNKTSALRFVISK